MKHICKQLILTLAIIGIFTTGAAAQESTASDPALIEKQVLKRIRSLPYYGVFDHIGFQVNGGTVTLYGRVYNAVNKQHAERYVEDVEGVTEVVNEIALLPPSSFDDAIRRRTLRAFLNGGSIYRYLQGPNPAVRIIVDRGRLTLEGVVGSYGDAKLANILTLGIPGTFEVTNNLKVLDSRL